MRINKLYLKNFRGFTEQEFIFRDRLTLIAGENGSGKSSLLEGLCVALGGWLCGFDGLDWQDYRNITKADRKKIVAKVNTALLEQIPVDVNCEVELQNGEYVTWSRGLTSLKGRTTTGKLKHVKAITNDLNQKIYSATDEDVILPLIAFYSTARLWNDFVRRERRINRESCRIDGYRRSIMFSNSISDAMESIDILAYLAYLDGDSDSLSKMNAILNAIRMCLKSMDNDIDVYYDVRQADFFVKFGNGEIKPYAVLSDGYRCVTGLIIDICNRIITLNPQFGAESIQNTGGVVLIDEIDLHLHPKWQQRVLGDLLNIFPKLQFITTSHAPSVIQSVKGENLMLLSNNGVKYPDVNVYGLDVNSVLLGVMGAKTRPEAIEQRFTEIYKHLDNGDLTLACEKTAELEQIVGDKDPELTGIKTTLDFESLEG